MRILFDGRYIQDRYPGVGRYAFELLRAAAAEAPEIEFSVLFAPAARNTRFPLEETLQSLSNVRMIATGVPPASVAEQFWPWLWRKIPADLYHVPFYIYPYATSIPTIVTVYDLIPIRYPGTIGWKRLLYRNALRHSLEKCRRVLTVSETSKAEICDWFGMDSAGISVVYPAGGLCRTREKPGEGQDVLERYGLNREYILYVGTDKPHKNLSMLLTAWSRVRCREERLLVLAGFFGSKHSRVNSDISSLGLSNSVKVLGAVTEAELPVLYSQSVAFVFPSLQEGFGLPVLEAMSCGAPVLCSLEPSLSEVVGDSALQIDPTNTALWTEAMERLLSSPELRGSLTKKGRARAKQFSRDRSARQLMNCYQHAILG